jgi:rubrerythrin
MTDQTSALEELRRDESSRKRFLKMAGVGAASSFALLLAACGDDEDEESSGATTSEQKPAGQDKGIAQFGEGDIGIANYALTLEYLEADFYAKAADSGMLKGQALELGKRFGATEAEHVTALEGMIKQAGGKPAKKPKTKFPLESQDAILDLAFTVENLGANAYLGQADKIKDPEILAAALSIHSVEGRHAAALGQVLGMPISPDGAFAKPADAETVLAEITPFIQS